MHKHGTRAIYNPLEFLLLPGSGITRLNKLAGHNHAYIYMGSVFSVAGHSKHLAEPGPYQAYPWLCHYFLGSSVTLMVISCTYLITSFKQILFLSAALSSY